MSVCAVFLENVIMQVHFQNQTGHDILVTYSYMREQYAVFIHCSCLKSPVSHVKKKKLQREMVVSIS